MTSEEYVKLQDVWLKATDIKKGDWVKVTRKADSHESGWNNSWTPGMDAVVEMFVRVVGVRDSNGIKVATSNFSFPSCRLPFFILEPAKKPKPEKYQFTPFEQVLTRNYNSDNWTANLFSYIEDGIFACTDAFWTQCIPYAGHEHLLGTTDEPEDWGQYYDKE